MKYHNQILNLKYLFIKTFILISSIFLFQYCKNKSDYPGYIKIDSGIHFRLLKIDNAEEREFEPGDYYTADLIYMTMEDSIFFKGRRKIQVFEPEFDGAIEECFAILQEGDSAAFIIDAYNFFKRTLYVDIPSFIADTGKVKVIINVLEIQSQDEFQKEKQAFLSWIKDFEEFENVNLKQFIQNENVNVQPTNTGMYSVNIKKGNGKPVNYGDTITIHYEGWFLNGKFFDSTRKRNQPFKFVYGTEWQVIKGIEEALSKMSEGEKTIFVMPSKLAFGYTGSSTGVIPPFTSVIFEIEVLKIN
ncbi:MAG: FKBP-type peptidyl-prolyl cis-trans isomerase [Bacteroidia bacterium]|nr:FKBP-type peptidyl-prolyl cis-trans isomerase [Bacteroidia bacterium]